MVKIEDIDLEELLKKWMPLGKRYSDIYPGGRLRSDPIP